MTSACTISWNLFLKGAVALEQEEKNKRDGLFLQMKEHGEIIQKKENDILSLLKEFIKEQKTWQKEILNKISNINKDLQELKNIQCALSNRKTEKEKEKSGELSIDFGLEEEDLYPGRYIQRWIEEEEVSEKKENVKVDKSTESREEGLSWEWKDPPIDEVEEEDEEEVILHIPQWINGEEGCKRRKVYI